MPLLRFCKNGWKRILSEIAMVTRVLEKIHGIFNTVHLACMFTYFVFPTSNAWKATLMGPFATLMVVLHSSLLGYGSG